MHTDIFIFIMKSFKGSTFHVGAPKYDIKSFKSLNFLSLDLYYGYLETFYSTVDKNFVPTKNFIVSY